MLKKKLGSLLSIVLGLGCTSQATTEEDVIRAHLETRGIDSRTAVFEGDDVIVEGDIVLSRASLVEEMNAELMEQEELIEKGYAIGPITDGHGHFAQVGVPQAKGIFFDFDSNVPQPWRDAMNYALSQWDAAHECIAAGNARVIEVYVTDLSGSTLADARPPINNGPRAGGIIPGNRIRIDTSVKDSTSTSYIRSIAIHEIGHALGFHHPWTGAHIPGTEKNTSTLGVGFSSYRTVMDYVYESTLSDDDKTSVNVLFKKTPATVRVPSHCPNAPY